MRKREVALIFAVVALDQITKYAIEARLSLGQSIELIKGFFSLTYTRNTGAAWSILTGQMTFFYIISTIALIVMTYFLWKTDKKETLQRVALALLIAGTLGNFIDRLMFQYVRDFLDFIIIGYDFPIFNVADISLNVAIGLLILEAFLEGRGK
ncbi:MAG: signal peptidase II [Firmicutes bacterium HGW-Firmicutes-20]|nr:MAG: signal peptidase II [Firmicutes bacterium HGW-Firmicutes-20]PKM69520.1 MAG: signal peptidase II [Firmicutes bacterium HGW-Firmicutes-19]